MKDLVIKSNAISSPLKSVADKVFNGQRISREEGVLLFKEAELSLLSLLADHVRKQKNGNYVFYNRNVHIEPTNICVYNCTFCSYSHHKSVDSWELTLDEMVRKVEQIKDDITEVHIVGAVHPARDLYYYSELIRRVGKVRSGLHIKAFTAIEIDYMIRRAGLSLKEGLLILKEAGLNSIPGGGAEIFDEKIRQVICGKKSTSDVWLKVHETAHLLDIPSNCTILYGHIEDYSHRIDHLQKLRDLQDRTAGFNAFIPLKFRSSNNELSWIGEVSALEDMRNYAVSRIFLDNIPHLKAYWPMIGKHLAALSLSFGVDDLDGTINDSTKIYSLAGADDSNPSMSTNEINNLILQSGYFPVERDSLYNILQTNQGT
jgi:aminodeoxyfutalosine synthase